MYNFFFHNLYYPFSLYLFYLFLIFFSISTFVMFKFLGRSFFQEVVYNKIFLIFNLSNIMDLVVTHLGILTLGIDYEQNLAVRELYSNYLNSGSSSELWILFSWKIIGGVVLSFFFVNYVKITLKCPNSLKYIIKYVIWVLGFFVLIFLCMQTIFWLDSLFWGSMLHFFTDQYDSILYFFFTFLIFFSFLNHSLQNDDYANINTEENYSLSLLDFYVFSFLLIFLFRLFLTIEEIILYIFIISLITITLIFFYVKMKQRRNLKTYF